MFRHDWRKDLQIYSRCTVNNSSVNILKRKAGKGAGCKAGWFFVVILTTKGLD